MMGLEFEWHAAKAEASVEAHGVSFELTKTIFKDPFAIERLDDRSCSWPIPNAESVFGSFQRAR